MEARGSKKPAWMSVMLLNERSRDLDEKVIMNSLLRIRIRTFRSTIVFNVLLLTFLFN